VVASDYSQPVTQWGDCPQVVRQKNNPVGETGWERALLRPSGGIVGNVQHSPHCEMSYWTLVNGWSHRGYEHGRGSMWEPDLGGR
jgi:hypothetical protein